MPVFIFNKNHIFNIHTNECRDFFLSENVDIIDVNMLVRHMEIKEKIVNNSDPHASKSVHKIIADYVVSKLKYF